MAKSEPAGAMSNQGFAAPGLHEPRAKLTWLPMNATSVRVCWNVLLTQQARGEMFQLLVDAESGEVLLRRCLTEHVSDASYRVFPGDSPRPMSPGLALPESTQAPEVARTLVTTPALNLTASPNGWIDDGVNETRGNNVDAHLDLDRNNLPDTPRPQGSPARVFDFPLDLTLAPSTYRDAAVTNLFYWCNFLHDRYYALGFTESAGNFQINNFGRGGAGADAVQAQAQDGSGLNNANFSSPPDGIPGRMQVFIFDGPTPDRDAALDAEHIVHEYTHGLTNRLVGGGSGLRELQSRGMGEGWSDFYGLALLSEAGDDVDGTYPFGAYVSFGRGGTFTQNYYFGIRRYPYSTDLLKNPLTFRDIDPTQARSHAGIPIHPRFNATTSDPSQVHRQGEVWCSTLWEVRAALVKKLGFPAGNELTLQLVTDGLKLAGVVENFDVPDDLRVFPLTSLDSQGDLGGPFTPNAQSYTLTNSGSAPLAWTATKTQPWLTLGGATSGTLAPGASAEVVVTINAAAAALGLGEISDTVTFHNSVGGANLLRHVNLAVNPPRFHFEPLDSDPGWTREGEWAFGQPTGQGAAFGIPPGFADPTRGATGVHVFGINLAGRYEADGGPFYLTTKAFDCRGWQNTQLQFQRWLNIDARSEATIEVSTDGATWTSIWGSGAVAVTDSVWKKVSFDLSTIADDQPAVFIRWGHTNDAALAAYSGWNIDDIEILGTSNNLTLLLPPSVREGTAAATGRVFVEPAPSADLVVTLTSSLPARLGVPTSVTIPAGARRVNFPLTAIDDALLNGSPEVTLTPSAAGQAGHARTLVVEDNERATVRSDPLAWRNDAANIRERNNLALVLQLTTAEPVALQPAAPVSFVDGAWTGNIALGVPGERIVVRAENGAGIFGESNPLLIDTADLDGDNLPDAWTAQYGVQGVYEDPDRDGLGNFLEYAMGLDPTTPDALPAPEKVTVIRRRRHGHLPHMDLSPPAGTAHAYLRR